MSICAVCTVCTSLIQITCGLVIELTSNAMEHNAATTMAVQIKWYFIMTTDRPERCGAVV